MLKIIETTPKDMGEAIVCGGSLQDISEHILRDGTVYCIRHCLRVAAIDNLRQTVIDHYAEVAKTKINYDGPTSRHNYHSIEKGVSQFQKTLHYFHAYVFNAIDDLPPNLKPQVQGLFESLAGLYNALTSQSAKAV